jgi:hypothetical protein
MTLIVSAPRGPKVTRQNSLADLWTLSWLEPPRFAKSMGGGS